MNGAPAGRACRSRPMPAVPLVLATLLCGGAMRTAKASDPAVPRYEPAVPAIPADTVRGWVVDANDWLDRGFLGVRHKQSAVTSAELGEPLVILTDSGSIVYPVNPESPSGPMMDNVRLIPFAEQRIVVTGRVITRAMERGIVINRVARAAGAAAARTFPAREVADSKVHGRITALSCWLGRADTGASYVECARALAAAGEPLILVTDSGYTYYPVDRDTLTDPPDLTKLVKYLGQNVVVSGTAVTRGRTRAVVIDSVAGYTPTETIKPEDKK